MKLDKTDKKILDTLQENAKITNAQLAAEAGISPPGMIERVKRLENSGVIKKYVALVNPGAVGKGTLAMVNVSLGAHHLASIDTFTDKINKMEEVLECYHIAGEDDFLLKIIVEDINSYEKFLLEKLTKVEGVSKIKTTFVLSTVKYNTKIHFNINQKNQ